MEEKLKDPIGQAILDFAEFKNADNIVVHSDLCDDDILPVEYLFRNFNQMPKIEQKALELCYGEVLEVGAGTACHSNYLKNKVKSTFAIDVSEGAIKYIRSQNIPCKKTSILGLKDQQFDCILILMNGLGLSGTLNELPFFLSHLKTLLKPNGKIFTDSTDIRYLYEDDEGGVWVDLNSKYLGEMQFQMEYGEHKSEWFDWLYVDFDTLKQEAEKVGLHCKKIIEDDNFHYLTVIEHL
ncbi:MAG TPA: class I SAM-dependent methyltransferase [Crocinitomix sp.]|nr:class I SAM-dependent methyltransferase [Crocinitomix sp.]